MGASYMNSDALCVSGVSHLELDGAIYFNLSFRFEGGIEQIKCAAKILGSEFEVGII